ANAEMESFGFLIIGNGGSTLSTNAEKFSLSSYYFDSQGNILGIFRNTVDDIDRFYMVNEESAIDDDGEITFVNVYERANNEVVKGAENMVGNYWNRIDDVSKIALV